MSVGGGGGVGGEGLEGEEGRYWRGPLLFGGGAGMVLSRGVGGSFVSEFCGKNESTDYDFTGRPKCSSDSILKPTKRTAGLCQTRLEFWCVPGGEVLVNMLTPRLLLAVMLVSGSSSAAEDSLNSSMTSTGSFMSGSQPDSSEAGQ